MGISNAELALILSLKDEVSKTAKNIKGDLLDVGKEAGGVKGILGDLGNMGKTIALGGLGLAAGAVGALTGALATTIGPASDLSETVSKVGVVFGDQADEMLAFGDTAARALGMTKNEALAAAGTYGNLFRSMGMAEGASADMSTGLVTLASDLASFNNMDPAEVLDKLRAGLTGETEPLKALGVNLNAAQIEAKALEMGLLGVDGELSASAKAQATYALVMEQTALAQGDFARTSDGLANQQRILSATFGDLKATIGTAILPAVTSLMGAFSQIVQSDQFQDLIKRITDGLSVFAQRASDVIGLLMKGDIQGALASVFGSETATKILDIARAVGEFAGKVGEFVREHAEPIKAALLAIGGLLAGAAIASGIMGIVGAIAALANPVTLIIGAVGLLGVAWSQNWGGIQEKTKAVIDWIKPFIEGALSAIRAFWDENGEQIIATVTKLWETVTKAFQVAVTWVMSKVAELLHTLATWWAENGDQVIATVTTLWDTVTGAFSVALEWIKKTVSTFIETVKAWWAEWGDSITLIFQAAWYMVLDIFETVTGVISSVFQAFVSLFKGDWEGFTAKISEAWDKLWSGVENVFGSFKVIIEEAFGLVKGNLEKIWESLKTKLEEIWSGLWEKIKTTYEEKKEELLTLISELPGKVIKFFTDTDWGDVGKKIIDGIAGGITEAVGTIKDAARKAAQRALDAAKEFLGISSPSRVFFEDVGMPISEGLAGGIVAGIPRAVAAIDNLGAAVVREAQRVLLPISETLFAKAIPTPDELKRMAGGIKKTDAKLPYDGFLGIGGVGPGGSVDPASIGNQAVIPTIGVDPSEWNTSGAFPGETTTSSSRSYSGGGGGGGVSNRLLEDIRDRLDTLLERFAHPIYINYTDQRTDTGELQIEEIMRATEWRMRMGG